MMDGNYDCNYDWVKASACSTTGCVEVRKQDGLIELRDSKDQSGPVLRFTWEEINAFFTGAMMGEFDHLES